MMSSSANSTASLVNPTLRLRAVTNSRTYDYLESRPREFEANSSLRWPLIVFLHGTGERGNAVLDVARQGLPRLLTDNPELSAAERGVGRDIAERFLIVAPQCAHYEVWNEGRLVALLDDVGERLNVDRGRIYLTGLSLGGFGAWSLGLRHPDRFAALAPICGGGRIADIVTAARQQPEALRRLGVWAFHGANDRVVPVEESERMVAGLKQAGVSDVKLTVYPDVAHDSWTATYANPELYRWFLQHRQ
jgi:predicted peptidase